MSNSKPMVSVIVLTYNQEHTIGRTIESILAQKTDFPFEVVIGEDASPSDNTRGVCERYAAQYPDIVRLMPKAANKGLLRNYADCTQACRGSYIACCAGDDWWHNPNKLQMQVDFLEQHPDCVLAYGSLLVYDEHTGSTSVQTASPPPSDLKTRIFDYNFISALTVCFRADMLAHIDYDEFIGQGFLMEDYPMWIIMAQHGTFHYIEESLATYTLAAESACNSVSFDRAARFDRSVGEARVFYAQRYHHPHLDDIKRDAINSLFVLAVRFNERKQALDALHQLKAQGLFTGRDFVKRLLCLTPFGFNWLRKQTMR